MRHKKCMRALYPSVSFTGNVTWSFTEKQYGEPFSRADDKTVDVVRLLFENGANKKNKLSFVIFFTASVDFAADKKVLTSLFFIEGII